MADTFNTLIIQIKSRNPQERSKAVLKLQPNVIKDERIIPTLVNVLCTDDDLNVIEDATWVLTRYGKQTTPSLLARINDDNPKARHNIIHAVGKLGDDLALPAIINATQDNNTAVQLKALYVLGQLGNPQAIPTLIGKLGDHKQDIQLTACEALNTFGDKALPHLLEALQSPSPKIQEYAANLLGDIIHTDAVEPLILAIKTNNWKVRFAILEALGQIGDIRALPIAQQHLNDENSRVRTMAKAVLKMLDRK